MFRPWILPALLLVILAARASAEPATEPATTRPAELVALITQMDKAVQKGGEEAAYRFFHATNPQERRLARAIAEYSASMVKLQVLMTSKFDAAAGASIWEAVGDCNDPAKAHFALEGDDKAILTFDGVESPCPLAKVQGKWLIDVPGLMQIIEKEGTDWQTVRDFQEQVADAISGTIDRINSGELKTAQEIITAIKSTMEELTPAPEAPEMPDNPPPVPQPVMPEGMGRREMWNGAGI